MLERSLIAAGLIVLGVVGYLVVRRLQLRRLQTDGSAAVPGLEEFVGGIPAILYFTTPDCVPCKTVQRPAVDRVRGEYEDSLQIIEVDANARPDVAAHWRVLSVPTTFILDRSGAPQHVNHGVTREKQLRKQIADVAAD